MTINRFLLLTAAIAALNGCGSVDESEPVSSLQQEIVYDCQHLATSCSAGCGAWLACLDDIPAKSNYPNMGSGVGCQGGVLWQCLEFAQRYWKDSSHNINIIAENGGNLVGKACNMCGITSSKWTKKSTSGSYIPQHGDLLVFECVSGTRPNGHVAVVDTGWSDVENTWANVVEQNKSCSGRATYAVTSAKCILHPLQ